MRPCGSALRLARVSASRWRSLVMVSWLHGLTCVVGTEVVACWRAWSRGWRDGERFSCADSAESVSSTTTGMLAVGLLLMLMVVLFLVYYGWFGCSVHFLCVWSSSPGFFALFVHERVFIFPCLCVYVCVCVFCALARVVPCVCVSFLLYFCAHCMWLCVFLCFFFERSCVLCSV